MGIDGSDLRLWRYADGADPRDRALLARARAEEEALSRGEAAAELVRSMVDAELKGLREPEDEQ